MNIKEKKKEIISSVNNTNDEVLIDEMYNLLHTNDEITSLGINEVPPELQTKISRAIDDYKQGRYITHEQIKLKVQQWLSK